jgi:peptide chain release factor 2
LLETITQLNQSIEDCDALIEMYDEAGEEDLLEELISEFTKIETSLVSLEMARMLSGVHDKHDAILEINSGAGGTEAQDWGEMLLRMYIRWAEKRGFKAELVHMSPGEVCGLKSATLSIEGQNAFGYLRSERGVHRLVRISPFDQNARRHTSFASVSVMPDIEEDIEVEVKEDDLRIDTYRASGAGGQHVNKTDSAVRLTHQPTGIVVACQNSRSQHKNKDTAMKLLKAKIYELEMEKKREEMNKISGERKKIDFGSQIRSYVMQPYQMVKDLRTSSETGNVQAVLDGDIDSFIESYLLSEEHNIDV